MATHKFSKHWTLITILLIVIIATGSIVACSRYSQSQPIEISTSQTQEPQDKIYIGGAVINPGFYPLRTEDTVETLIQAAGGAISSTEFNWLKLCVLQTEEQEQPQKIDLNRAEAWLLETLSGIGETKAQAIIDYRKQNGPFSNINELTKVEGIGITTYEEIKHLITVAD